jgi:hypothetical protein
MTAKELRERMERANLSIYDLGDMIGRSHVTVWRWKCGIKNNSGQRDPNRPVPVLWDQRIKELIGRKEARERHRQKKKKQPG